MAHPWVEDSNDFEAVLVCTNQLPSWDRAAILRAFQTFMFDNATVSDDEPSYKHQETGGVVRYEAGVLAIDYSNSPAIFPDIIAALSALGWRSAEVFHPAITMEALLSEIGRSIPASLNFDVRPARVQEENRMSETEAQNLLLQGSKRNTAVKEGERDLVLNELQSLGNVTATKPIRLMDDDEPTVMEETIVFRPAAPMTTRAASSMLDDEPGVVDLTSLGSGQPTFYSSDAETVPPEETAPPAIENPLPEEQKVSAIPATEPVSRPSAAKPPTEQPLLDKTPPPQNQPPAAKAADTLVAGVGFIRVGHSIFCFDFPDAPLSTVDVDLIAVDAGINPSQTIHLHPGAINSPLRWNLLDEIPVDEPLFSERLANEMALPSNSRLLIALIMMAVKKEQVYAGLRDVLMFVDKDVKDMTAAMASLSPAAEMLLTHANACGTLGLVRESVFQHFGALAIVPVGQSFVDLLDGQDNLPDHMENIFSVREVAESATAKMLVVHVDGSDGTFVVWLAKLLRAVASIYSVSRRLVKYEAVESAPVDEIVEPSPPPVSAELSTMQATLNTLMEQVKRIEESIPMAAN